MGSFGFSVKPHGTLMPQMPARLQEIVKMSRQIHLQRVVGFLADLERRRRRGRRHNRVHFFKSLQKIVADERADFLRPQIIRVVIAAAQNVGAENDSALHLRAETRAARLGCKVPPDPFPSTRSAVADAVEPREIRRRLRRRDDVISRDRVIRVRQGNLHNLRAEFLRIFSRRRPRRLSLPRRGRQSCIPSAGRASDL